MATIATNLTNLSNARVNIINKLNNTLGYSIPSTTPLSNISPYINTTNNYMVDFMNMKRKLLNFSNAIQVVNYNTSAWDKTRYVRYCDITTDGFLVVRAWLQKDAGSWMRILFCGSKDYKITQSLIDNNTPEQLNTILNEKWICVNYAFTHNDWRGCTIQFAGWVKAGQQVAITCSKWFEVFNIDSELLHY